MLGKEEVPMKLSYWVAPCLGDHMCYSIRAKTKKECVALVQETGSPESFGKPKRVEVEYDNALDLITLSLGEGGGYWESL